MFLILIRMDEGRQPLSRKLSVPSSKINPYRMVILMRLVVLGFFFHYRVVHPVEHAYALWLVSIICEIWFTLSWILDQFPKWLPVIRQTYLDRLSLRQVIYKIYLQINLCIKKFYKYTSVMFVAFTNTSNFLQTKSMPIIGIFM